MSPVPAIAAPAAILARAAFTARSGSEVDQTAI
jgi:hypothetical protein